MSQLFENKDLINILNKKRSVTAEDMVKALNIEINRDNRKVVFQKVRKALPQYIDINDGCRENKNLKGETLYEL